MSRKRRTEPGAGPCARRVALATRGLTEAFARGLEPEPARSRLFQSCLFGQITTRSGGISFFLPYYLPNCSTILQDHDILIDSKECREFRAKPTSSASVTEPSPLARASVETACVKVVLRLPSGCVSTKVGLMSNM